MIRKKGKGWEVAVFFGRDENGKQLRIWRTAPTRREAREIEASLQYERSTGSLVPGPRITVGEFLDRWLRDVCQVRVSPKTYANYTSIIRLHIMPSIGHVDLGKLTTPVVQAMVTRLHQKERLAASTVCLVHRVLKTAMGVAVDWKLVRENPARGVKLPRQENRSRRVLTIEELQRLMSAPMHDWLALSTLIAATTGMRRGEIAGLRWQNVDLAGGHLRVKSHRVRVGTEVIEGRPKTENSLRGIPIPEILRMALLRHQEEQETLRTLLGGQYLGEDLVITSATSRPVDPTWMTNEFRKVCRENRIPEVRLHSLRHTYATMLLNEAKLPVSVVSRLLGHARVTTTLSIYAHVTEQPREESAEYWDRILNVHTPSTQSDDTGSHAFGGQA
jgi:integrase